MQNRANRRALWIAAALVALILLVVAVVLLLSRDRPTTSASATTPVTTTATTPVSRSDPSETAPATMEVQVFFHRGEPDDASEVEPVTRTVPRSPAVGTAALGQLLGGPTEAEQARGHTSLFGPPPADALSGLTVADGVARADFRDFREALPAASSSYGSTALLAELDATLRQFPTVTSTVYSFDGDVTAFYEFVQRSAPVDPAAAEAAERFLVDVVGMDRPVRSDARRAGADTVEASFQARSPDGTPNPAQTTVVSLRRDDGWSVVGTRTDNIVVTAPEPGGSIATPLEVTGRAHTFEGNVVVRVLAGTAEAPTEVGRGPVTGGGDRMRGFSGEIAFPDPGADAGWVLFVDVSAADGKPVRVTSIPVGFAS